MIFIFWIEAKSIEVEENVPEAKEEQLGPLWEGVCSTEKQNLAFKLQKNSD